MYPVSIYWTSVSHASRTGIYNSSEHRSDSEYADSAIQDCTPSQSILVTQCKHFIVLLC